MSKKTTESTKPETFAEARLRGWTELLGEDAAGQVMGPNGPDSVNVTLSDGRTCVLPIEALAHFPKIKR